MKKRDHYYDGDTLYVKCCKCGEMKPSNEFGNNTRDSLGLETYCSKCRNEYHLRYREEHSEIINKRQRERRSLNGDYTKRGRRWKKEFKEKHGYSVGRDHGRVRDFLKKYDIHFTECSICGNDKNIETHHPSYDGEDSWKYVVVCCRKCHRRIHNGIIECPEPIDITSLAS